MCNAGDIKMNKDPMACKTQAYSLYILELPCKEDQPIHDPKTKRSEVTAGGFPR